MFEITGRLGEPSLPAKFNAIFYYSPDKFNITQAFSKFIQHFLFFGRAAAGYKRGAETHEMSGIVPRNGTDQFLADQPLTEVFAAGEIFAAGLCLSVLLHINRMNLSALRPGSRFSGAPRSYFAGDVRIFHKSSGLFRPGFGAPRWRLSGLPRTARCRRLSLDAGKNLDRQFITADPA